MDATFTPEELGLIWLALKNSEPQSVSFLPDIRAHHHEAMTIVASELRRVGVFPPLRGLSRKETSDE